MDAVNGGCYGVCTRLKGVKGWCWVVSSNPWLFTVAASDKKEKKKKGRCCMEAGGSGQ